MAFNKSIQTEFVPSLKLRKLFLKEDEIGIDSEFSYRLNMH